MNPFVPEPLPTPERARRQLIVGVSVLATVLIVLAIALPLGVRGSGVARLDVVGAAPVSSSDAARDGSLSAPPGTVDLRMQPVARTESSTTATVELVGASAAHAQLDALREGAWTDAGERISLGRQDAAGGVALRVKAREDTLDEGWDGTVTVRLTVSQGLLPDIDEIEINLFES